MTPQPPVSLSSCHCRMKSGTLLGSFTLPVAIQTTDGLSWSDEGQLAIATKKGVLVYEVTPDATCRRKGLNFVKTFVENESDVNPLELVDVPSEDELAQLPRHLRSDLVMDRLVSPHPVTGETVFKQPARVGWSPASEAEGGRPCLMVLTLDRRLRAMRQRGRRWETVWDVSKLLSSHFNSLQPTSRRPPCEASEVVRSVQSRCSTQATSCWCWLGESLLLTAQHSGHLVLLSAGNTPNTPTVRSVHRCEVTEVSCLRHCTVDGLSLLIVAGGDGRVELLKMELEKISSLGLIWADQDRLKVNLIQVSPKTSANYFTVILAKMNFCVFLKIRIVNGCRLEFGKSSHINTGMTAIVGLELYRDKLILSSQKSGIKICNLKSIGNGLEPVSLDIRRDDYFCHGMAASGNKTVLACLDNISSYHDHLILREGFI